MKKPTAKSEIGNRKAPLRVPQPITSLAEFQALVDSPIRVVFDLQTAAGVELRSVELRRISPGLAEQARQFERKIQPPWKKDMGRYDELDPKYLELRETAAKKVRSLIVYACCPQIAAAKPGLTAIEEIHAFVQGVLSENILNLIAFKAQEGGLNLDVEVEERANFTSTAG